MFRKQAKAFEADHIALKLGKEMIANGEYDKLRFLEKVFTYIPLEHSENLEDQAQWLEILKKIIECHENEGQKKYGEWILPYIQKHYDVIERYLKINDYYRFGRFPHRNEVLGRESTAEELEYLKDCDRFGQ